MRRPILMFLLTLGVIFGFGSGIAHLRYGGGWGHCRAHERWSQLDAPATVAPPPAPAPTTVVIQPPAAAAPVYPQVIVIPQGSAIPAPAPGATPPQAAPPAK